VIQIWRTVTSGRHHDSAAAPAAPDVDRSRLAFYGVSLGADAGVVLTALDPRLKASVLQGTGLPLATQPETDLLNYAPRVHVPTMMLSGRYDFESSVERAQKPRFALLGCPPAHKRHVLLESGHALPMGEAAREVLAWLDRYLGPVVQGPRALVD
jgi:pimeloyl-ACP methyl ester carboxylesterase